MTPRGHVTVSSRAGLRDDYRAGLQNDLHECAAVKQPVELQDTGSAADPDSDSDRNCAEIRVSADFKSKINGRELNSRSLAGEDSQLAIVAE